jgi:hypothetical protein
MEVHAHSHTPGKKWTHYLWEFLMLFLAVFCGFLAEYQLEHYLEKQRADEYAVSLHRDIIADTAIINANINELKFCTKRIDSLISFLNDKDLTPQNIATIYRLSVFAFVSPLTKPNESTLKQLINSGALRYFKRNELSDEIKIYTLVIQDFTDYFSAATDFNLEFRKFQSRVLNLDPLIEFVSRNQYSIQSMVANTETDYFLHYKLISNDSSLISEYANWCALKKFYMNNSAAKYINFITEASKVLSILNKEYHIK